MHTMPSLTASRLLPVTGTSLWRKRQLMVAGVCASAWLSGCGVFLSNDEFGLAWSGKPLAQLIDEIDKTAGRGNNLSSALRIHVLNHFRGKKA